MFLILAGIRLISIGFYVFLIFPLFYCLLILSVGISVFHAIYFFSV